MQQIKESTSVTIRQPATANLMVDSIDRAKTIYPLANTFQISKPQALLNGFFHRVGTTEMVLEWFTPNIAAAYKNNTITIDISGGVGVTGTGSVSVSLADGFRTQAALVDTIKDLLDVLGATSTTPDTTFALTQTATGIDITPDQDVWIRFSGAIPTLLGIASSFFINYGTDEGLTIGPADIRAIRYLDFISAQLTYNQDLKDSSTAPIVRDVLARWYMAYDNYTATDQYGFPILMGYEAFTVRRTFTPPKQIRWDNVQPVGNIAFEVYNDLNEAGLLPGPAYMTNGTDWLMTLQVSED